MEYQKLNMHLASAYLSATSQLCFILVLLALCYSLSKQTDLSKPDRSAVEDSALVSDNSTKSQVKASRSYDKSLWQTFLMEELKNEINQLIRTTRTDLMAGSSFLELTQELLPTTSAEDHQS